MPRIARRLRVKKINLILAVARAGEGQQIPRPSPMVPSWHTKKEKGRFGVGAELRGQIPDRSPIFRRPGGPSKAPLADRPTSSLPNPPGQVKKKKKKRVGSESGRSFEVRSSIGRRSSGDQSDRVKLRSLIVLHPPVPRSRAVDPTQIGFLRCGATKEKKERAGSELGRGFEVKSSIGR